METLAPKMRGCRFPWESDILSYHSRYSHKSCRLECGLDRALLTSDCLPWYLPQQPDNPQKPCSVQETAQFLWKMNNVLESDCDCLPDCDYTDLHYTVSTTSL